MNKIFRVKMLPTVKYDGTPKHDKMCSKPHSQIMAPQQKKRDKHLNLLYSNRDQIKTHH